MYKWAPSRYRRSRAGPDVPDDWMPPAPKIRSTCLAAVAALAVSATSAARAQEARPPAAPPADTWPGAPRALTFFPGGSDVGRGHWTAGGVWQIAPMFTASYAKGLGDGFSADVRLQTVVLYNELGIGGQWATQVGPFTVAPMLHLDGFFGTLGKLFVQTSEFDAVGWGVLLDPGIRVGMRVARDAWLTLQVESYLSLYQAAKLGDLVLSPESRTWEGVGSSLIVEYATRSAGVVYYGVSLYHTRANYPLWFNVESSGSSESVSAKKIWYLGLLAGYEF